MAKKMANLLQAEVKYAEGSVHGWNQPVTSDSPKIPNPGWVNQGVTEVNADIVNARNNP